MPYGKTKPWLLHYVHKKVRWASEIANFRTKTRDLIRVTHINQLAKIELREPGPLGSQYYCLVQLYACTLYAKNVKRNPNWKNNRLFCHTFIIGVISIGREVRPPPPPPGHAYDIGHKTLYDYQLCLVASNKRQIQWRKIRRNSQEHWITGNFQADANSSKHELVNAMKSVRLVQQLAYEAVRWLEDKYAPQQQLGLILNQGCGSSNFWIACTSINWWRNFCLEFFDPKFFPNKSKQLCYHYLKNI